MKYIKPEIKINIFICEPITADSSIINEDYVSGMDKATERIQIKMDGFKEIASFDY